MAKTNLGTLRVLGKGASLGILGALLFSWPAVLFPLLYDKIVVVVWFTWLIMILFVILFIAVKYWDEMV